MIEGVKATREWKRDLSKNDRLDLIVDIGDTCYDETESFEYLNLGSYLAYLFMGIANGENNDGINLLRESREGMQVLDFFKEHFPEEHPIWRFITVIEK